MQTLDIANKLGITSKQVSGYAWSKGIKKDKAFVVVRSDCKFNYEEADYIYENFADMTNDALAEKLGCETKDVTTFARTHKLKKSSSIYKNFNGMPIESKKFIIENYRTMRTEEIARIVGQHPDKVGSYAYLHGIRKDKNLVVPMCEKQDGLTTEQKEYILKNYESKTNEEIIEQLSITFEQLHSYASNRKLKKNILLCKTKPHYFEQCLTFHKDNNYGIDEYLGHEVEPKIDSSKLYKSKYGKWTCNPNYFEKIDNEWKAYWLGFLYADGYICHEKKNGKVKNSVNLCLATLDENHLIKFQNSVQANNPIKHRESHLNGKTYYNSKISICNKKMCEDLIELGCVPRKSLTLNFPNNDQLPEEYHSHFIRGYFDGDGCVSINEKQRYAVVNFVGTKEFLECIESLFRKLLGIPKVTITINNDSKAYSLQYGNIRSVELIYKYLYKNANIFLDRKLEKFNEVFSLA